MKTDVKSQTSVHISEPLFGKIALITGGTAGIGLAIAQAYLRAGASVAICGRNQDRLQNAVCALNKEFIAEGDDQSVSARILGLVCDVTDSKQVEQLVAQTIIIFGKVDILVNSAGMTVGGPTMTIDPTHWYEVIDCNLNGVYRVTLSVLQRSGMLERKWGRIINIASTAGKQGVPRSVAYCASKHGVIGLTRSLGLELADLGITVNAICPGFVETELSNQSIDRYANQLGVNSAEAKRRLVEKIPIARYLMPSEIAPAAVFLATDEASSIIAQAINVCGGLSTT